MWGCRASHRHFDKVELDEFLVSDEEFAEAEAQISPQLNRTSNGKSKYRKISLGADRKAGSDRNDKGRFLLAQKRGD